MAATTIESDDSGALKSPRSPPNSHPVSSPWRSVVKGEMLPVSVAPSPTISSVEEQSGNDTSDLCPPETVPETVTSRDDSGTEGQVSDGGINASKKPVWNKPSNGVFDAVSPVMDAVSWPALGEISKFTPKSSSSESLKALADGPLPPALQVVTENSSSSSHKQTAAHNFVASAKQRSIKRGGGSFNSNMSAKNPNLGMENQPSTTHVEASPRKKTQSESPKAGFGSEPRNGNDQQNQRNTYRRSNSGPHSRGDGSYHHSYGGKRDQDREWKQHSRSFNGRDTQMHSQRGYPRGYIRPSVHPPPPFIPPQMSLLRPYGSIMMYSDLPSPVFYVQGPPPPPESLVGMPPLVAPMPPPMYFLSDPMLPARIVSQVDYYFSNENLVKDIYLRNNMDEQGWVPVSLIARFKKVLYLTDNIQLILDALRASTTVEVQGDKIRKRNDWMRWLMQPPAQDVGNHDVLASQLQGVTLDGINKGGRQETFT